MIKCNQKKYDTILDFNFARIREGLMDGRVTFYFNLDNLFIFECKKKKYCKAEYV